MVLLDCEQSLFFFIFSESSAHARELPSCAFSQARGHFVSHELQKKERLLVVYGAFILLIKNSTT